jgi:hypothetical protein
MRLLVVALGLAAPATLAAQGASPYVPLDDWAMPVIEHLIRMRAMVDPAPLTRPLTVAQVAGALARADTTTLSPALRGTLRRLRARFWEPDPDGVYRADLFVEGAGATHDRRELLREAGDEWVGLRGGMRLSASFGALAVSALPYFDTHLNHDPDWPGDSVQTDIPGRFTDAYISVQTRFADLTLGATARNWGPAGIDGLLLSGYPFSYDHVAVRIGTEHVRIETILTDLDDALSPDSAVIRRFFVAHRVSFRPMRQVMFALGQGTLWRGAGRSWELRWLNPLKLARQTAIDESLPDSGNTAYLGDLRVELPAGIVLSVQALVDDWSVHSPRALPNRFAGTVVIDAPVGPAAVRALVTGVSSVAYRTQQGPDFALLRHGVGLGRNHSDYGQATLSGSMLVAPGVLVEPELTWLRQGEGDFDTPFPPFPNPDYPTLFVGNVETTWRLALGGRASVHDALDLSGNAGVHLVRTAAHVPGATRSAFVGAIRVTWRFGGRIGG